MKKFFIFALTLVASVLVFTACNDKKSEPTDEKAATNPIVGTWFYADDENDYFYTFEADGKYQRIEDYYMNGRDVVAHEHIVADGTYKLDGDIVTATITKTQVYMDGSKTGDPFDDFWSAVEKMKFKVEGSTLTLTHDYESKDAWSETLKKK